MRKILLRSLPATKTDKDIPLPSKTRLSRRKRLILTRGGMLFCFGAAVLCILSVPVLSSFRVRHIEIEGISHYAEQDILSIVGVSENDELLAVSPDEVKATLRENCPYLTEIDVRRGLGKLKITVVECVPRWALLTDDGRAVLLTENLYVPEICAAEAVSPDICVLRMALPELVSTENNGDMQTLRPEVGSFITGSSSALSLLSRITEALNGLILPSQPTSLDLSNLYAVTLTLADGTVINLHECTDPTQQIKNAAAAVSAYRLTGSIADGYVLYVDADYFSRISIRTVPRIVGENAE